MNDRLLPENRLYPGQFLTSASGVFRLGLQPDGNLVLYRADGAALWATQTAGLPIAFANMQADGNFVLYLSDGQPVWNTETNGLPGSVLILQDDGNLVVYGPNGQPFWQSGTSGG